jgi:hypothetical protein
LLAAAGAHVVRGLNREQWLGLCGEADIVVAVDSTHEIRRRLLEAMGHGCVPVVTGSQTGQDVLIQDGINGVVATDGASAATVARVRAFAADDDTWLLMRIRAHTSARAADYRADQMIEAYLDLFARVVAEADAGGFRRPADGTLLPPPAQVLGADIFPVTLDYPTIFGRFPSVDDARRFAEESGRAIPIIEEAKEDADGEVTNNGA